MWSRESENPGCSRIASLDPPAPPTTYHLRLRPLTSDFRLPTVLISLASLGWGDDPPYPPSVGVLARWAGRARLRTRTVRGSRRLPPRLPPSDCVDFPRFARVRGPPPIPPVCRRTDALVGSRPSEDQDRALIASAPAASSAFRLPTSDFRLPPSDSAFRLSSENRIQDDALQVTLRRFQVIRAREEGEERPVGPAHDLHIAAAPETLGAFPVGAAGQDVGSGGQLDLRPELVLEAIDGDVVLHGAYGRQDRLLLAPVGVAQHLHDALLVELGDAPPELLVAGSVHVAAHPEVLGGDRTSV